MEAEKIVNHQASGQFWVVVPPIGDGEGFPSFIGLAYASTREAAIKMFGSELPEKSEIVQHIRLAPAIKFILEKGAKNGELGTFVQTKGIKRPENIQDMINSELRSQRARRWEEIPPRRPWWLTDDDNEDEDDDQPLSLVEFRRFLNRGL